MLTIRRSRREADRLDAALNGAPASAELTTLAALAADLRAAGNAFVAADGQRGRGRLLLAVEEARSERKTRVRMGGRGVVVLATAMAGGGILAASAAQGTDPATLVRNAVEGLPFVADAPPAEPVAAVSITGDVTASAPESGWFELRTDDRVWRIRVDPKTSIRGLDGTALRAAALRTGDRVQVEGLQNGRAVDAKSVIILARPEGTASPVTEREAAGATPTAPATRPPRDERTAAPTPTATARSDAAPAPSRSPESRRGSETPTSSPSPPAPGGRPNRSP